MNCSVPGCNKPGIHYPHPNAPNVRFCDKHMGRILVKTVESIADGTHPDLQQEPASC